MYIIPQLKGSEKVLYLRKSRSDDPLASVEEVLAKHEQMLDEWVEQNQPEGGPIPEANRFREVVSGETLESRPQMQELMRLIEDPKIKAIVCKEPSRLSRGDLQDIGYLVKILRYSNTIVMTLRETYDLRDDRDREQFERELMRGNDYLQYQRKIMMDGKLLAVKNGCYIGPSAPYGYKKVTYKEGKNTCHTLEPHPEEAPVVKHIFDLYLHGLGTLRICEALDAEHMETRKGGRWSPETILTILENVHYLGKVRWNYRPTSRKVEDGEIKTLRAIADECLIFEGRHEAIIDQETWDAVQKIKGRLPRNKRGSELKNPLSRILRCSCGRAMTYKQIKRGGVLAGAPRFMCGDTRCLKSGSALASEVLDEVSRVLQECIDDFELRIKKGADDSAKLHKELIERLEKKLEDLRELEIKQWDEKTKGGMPDHVFERLNGKTVAEIAEVTQALCEAKNSAPIHVDLHEKVYTFKAALELLNDPDAPVKEQNKLLQACIEKIVYSRPRLAANAPTKVNPEPFRLDFTLRV